VLVMIERQHGEVGGLPDQNWSLRVTQVYRRYGSDWRLAHRVMSPAIKAAACCSVRRMMARNAASDAGAACATRPVAATA
ncbi:hypothetical protein AB9F38_35860, partial [Rhizobium leguminosarum]